MADSRSALDRHLGISAEDHSYNSYSRYRALLEYVGNALTARDYAAAQVYASLIIAENLSERGRLDVHLTDWEDLAIGISSHLRDDLRKIADSIDRLDS